MRLALFRETLELFHSRSHRTFKVEPKPRTAFLVVSNRFPQFLFGLVKDVYRDQGYLASMSLNTSSVVRLLAVPSRTLCARRAISFSTEGDNS